MELSNCLHSSAKNIAEKKEDKNERLLSTKTAQDGLRRRRKTKRVERQKMTSAMEITIARPVRGERVCGHNSARSDDIRIVPKLMQLVGCCACIDPSLKKFSPCSIKEQGSVVFALEQ